jgi:hypothetical protein
MSRNKREGYYLGKAKLWQAVKSLENGHVRWKLVSCRHLRGQRLFAI